MTDLTYQYTPRDISWLDFNYRVLQEATDESVPLYERIKFLAIFSSNLDEFFRVRVAALKSFKAIPREERKRLLDIQPKKLLRQILAIVDKQQNQFGRVVWESIVPALHRENIFLINEERLSAAQLTFLEAYFYEKVAPLITQQICQEGGGPPFLENQKLYFLLDRGPGKPFHLINIPSQQLPRFIVLPEKKKKIHYIIYLDDLIRAVLPRWTGSTQVEAYSVKVTRDAELYISDEFSGDLLAKIKASLAEREIGMPTRFLYDQTMPKSLQERVQAVFNLTKYDMVPGSRYHNFNDFFAFPDPIQRPSLYDQPLPPLNHPRLAKAKKLFKVIRKADQLLHFPYQKYEYVSRLITEAAANPAVHTLRITLYRVASNSAIVSGLKEALAAGKKVEVFVEAKARFDEASNLYWGKELELAGAKVRYSFPGIKVHSKLLLIECHEAADIAYLGTGNFNEKTARLYADHALLTADERLTKEVREVFEFLSQDIKKPTTEHLLVAPFNLREQLLARIDREIAVARAGKPAFIFLKLNSLEEQGMIDKLYEANNAGVKIRLIVRGICCLVPGLEGQSEHIEVISILDRFLEHARIYRFGNNGKEEIFLASADWMSRNLFRRIEVAFPVYDPVLQQELKDLLTIQWADNVKARIISPTKNNAFRKRTKAEILRRSQLDSYQYLRKKKDH